MINRAWLWVGITVAVFAGFAAPASAHPFGPPSTARISVDGARASVAWLAAEDDWVALGQSVGAFEDPTSGVVTTSMTGEQKLQQSEAVHRYLLERIGVNQNGTACSGRIISMEQLLTKGAQLEFECPEPIVEVAISVSVLTDLNEAYRTMLSADSPATPDRALFTTASSTQHLSFSGTYGSIGSSIAVGVGAVVVLGVVLLVVLRRRTRSRT